MKNLLVVTSYPEKGVIHSKKTVGIASYTKTLLQGLIKYTDDFKITILAEYFNQANSYLEEGLQIERIWQRNNLVSFFKLGSKIIHSKNDSLILSFEAYMFGSPLYNLLVLFFLLIAKLQGKKIYILLHQVPSNLKLLESNYFKALLFNLAKKILFFNLNLIAHKIIVFEEQLEQQFGFTKKTITLPHLIPTVQVLEKNKARQILGWDLKKFYCLYFGYLAPYKGIDCLLENWPNLANKKLIIAGDINPNHKKNQAILNFVATLKKKAQEKNVIMTGFIPEKDIATYFSAADLIILPYRTFMSSSGPLSLALAYQKPILLSKPLAAYTKSSDFQRALKAANLSINDIIFEFKQKNLLNSLENIQQKQSKLEQFASFISRERSLPTISKKLANIIE